MDDELLESGDRGKKSLRVYLINPPLDEPWRTRQNYIDDRNQMEESFRRSAEAHELLIKSYRNNLIGLIIALFVMIGTSISAFVIFDNYLDTKLVETTINDKSTHSNSLNKDAR